MIERWVPWNWVVRSEIWKCWWLISKQTLNAEFKKQLKTILRSSFNHSNNLNSRRCNYGNNSTINKVLCRIKWVSYAIRVKRIEMHSHKWFSIYKRNWVSRNWNWVHLSINQKESNLNYKSQNHNQFKHLIQIIWKLNY